MYIIIAADRSTKKPINRAFLKDNERGAKKLAKELEENGWEKAIILQIDSVSFLNGMEITGVLEKAQEFTDALHSDPPINIHKKRLN